MLTSRSSPRVEPHIRAIEPQLEPAPGQAFPLGASVADAGVNFSVYARDATGIELMLFDREDDARPAHTIALDPVNNRTYHYWHVLIPGLVAGQLYGYRAAGPF